MKEKTKPFHILLSESEINLIRKEAEKRSMSMSEFIRTCIKNEVTAKSSYDKVLAVKKMAAFKG